MIYLLIVNIALVIGFGLYQISFRKLTFFQWNRFYLLGMVFFSLLIPIGLFIDLSSFFVKEEMLPTIHFTAIDDVVIYAASTQKPLYMIDLLTWFYIIGVAICLMFLIFKLYKLRMAMQYVSTDSSFSFFKKVVLGSKVKDIQEINTHESVHVEQGHSYDIVFMELLSVFNWFNPVVYFIKKELKFQHECIADEICSTDKVSYAELLLAHAMHTDVNMLRHEFSNQSFLKKRIMMLFKNKSTNKQKYLYLSVLPMVIVVTISTLVFNTSKAKAVVKNIEHKVEEVSIRIAESKESNNQKQIAEEITSMKAKSKEFITTKVYADTLAVPVDATKFVEWCKSKLKENNLLEKYTNTGLDMTFTVNTSGEISDLVVKNTKSGELTDLDKVFVGLPKWLPAIKNGHPVTSKVSFMIAFSESGSISSNTERVALSQEEKKRIREDVISGKIQLKEGEDELFLTAEINPEPPEGMTAFRRWIGENYQYPQAAIDEGVKGTVQVSFIVEKDGSFSEIKTVKDLGFGTSEAAIAMLKKAPKWSPAIQNGRAVRVQYILPIKLDLSHPNDEKKDN